MCNSLAVASLNTLMLVENRHDKKVICIFPMLSSIFNETQEDTIAMLLDFFFVICCTITESKSLVKKTVTG